MGLATAFWSIRGLVLLAPKDLPRLDEVSIDAPVLIFTLVVSLLAGILFGMAPALRISRVDLNETLREGGRSQSGGKRVRFDGEYADLADCTVADKISNRPGGRGLLFGHAAAPAVDSRSARSRRCHGCVFIAHAEFGWIHGRSSSLAAPEQQIEATVDSVSPNYFRVTGVPLIRGSFFDGYESRDTTPVMLIDETMAKRFLARRGCRRQVPQISETQIPIHLGEQLSESSETCAGKEWGRRRGAKPSRPWRNVRRAG